MFSADTLVLPFNQVGIEAIAAVGGKNASLGEMIQELAEQGVRVPGGFATTAGAYRHLLRTRSHCPLPPAPPKRQRRRRCARARARIPLKLNRDPFARVRNRTRG